VPLQQVQSLIAALVDSSPGALDTLNELAAALGDDPNFATTMTNALALKAPLASPALTGNPTAPNPAAGDNDTSIATTAFVNTNALMRYVNTWQVDSLGFNRLYFETITGAVARTLVRGLSVELTDSAGGVMLRSNTSSTHTDKLLQVGNLNTSQGFIRLTPGTTTTLSGSLEMYHSGGSLVGYIGNATTTVIEMASASGRPYHFLHAAPKSAVDGAAADDLVRFSQLEPNAGLGAGQTWHDLTATRVHNTVYYNSSARPIAVSAFINNGDTWIRLYIDGVEHALNGASGQGNEFNNVFSVIPAGSNYKLESSHGYLTKWYELY
jgi:hypothetical protein